MDDQTKPKSNAALAIEQLREMIFSGGLGAGTDHLESELAETMGMSRTPVREAVVALEGQGLLEVRPRKGVRITPVSPADMAEIYDVLTELESLAAANAAVVGYGEEDLAPIEDAIDRMDAALAAEDRDTWAVADDMFHTELVRLGRNTRLAAIVRMMADQVRRARLVTLYIRPLPVASNADHRAVLDAIRRGDAEAARAIHRAHRANAKTALVGLLQKHHLNSL
ncbi:MAG: GntR family transcriptional regulator [Pseudomonadota bacterium]